MNQDYLTSDQQVDMSDEAEYARWAETNGIPVEDEGLNDDDAGILADLSNFP